MPPLRIDTPRQVSTSSRLVGKKIKIKMIIIILSSWLPFLKVLNKFNLQWGRKRKRFFFLFSLFLFDLNLGGPPMNQQRTAPHRERENFVIIFPLHHLVQLPDYATRLYQVKNKHCEILLSSIPSPPPPPSSSSIAQPPVHPPARSSVQPSVRPPHHVVWEIIF